MKRNFLRSAVSLYISHCPLEKGKGRLLHELRPWLRANGERAVKHTLFGCAMELDLSDAVQEWIYFFGAYELPLVNYLTAKLKPGMVFADIGAQVGQFTLLAAKSVGPQGHVHSFEPAPGSFAMLSRNVALNFFENVSLHQIAVADFSGEAQLFIPKQSPEDRNTGVNSLRRKAGWSDTETVTVPVRPLDEVFSRISRLDVMKIDVEGAEFGVLHGAERTLKAFRPLIAVEAEENSAQAFGYSTRELKAFLERLGYRLLRIKREGKKSKLVSTDASECENFSMLLAVPNTNDL